MIHWSTCVLLLWAAASADLGAQPRALRVTGMLRACYPARITDKQLPVDSLLLDSAVLLPDTVLYVVCMASTQDVIAVQPNGGNVSSTAGIWRRTSIIATDGPLILIDPVELPSLSARDVFQIVVPVCADTVVIDSTVTTNAWNGRSGGIIAIEANVLVSSVGRIDLSGMGFRGGKRSNNGGSCGIVQACDPSTSDRTAGKGESIRITDPLCTNGHTPWANGGGGGDAHNAGGGGGGNGGAGGRGGNQYVCSAVPGMYGMSGMGLYDGSQQRMFLGGGGGGGHQNNNVATDGASGGGIVMICARTITGDSLSIISRGGDAGPRAGNDGGGGGGAGGSIYIESCYAECKIALDVQGGTGSMCGGGHGPGGGGGGGRIIMNPALLQNFRTSFVFNLAGGAPGTVSPGNPNGAQYGAKGIVIAPCSSTAPHRLIIQRRADVGDTIALQLNATDTTSSCETLVTHQVRFVGSAHTVLLDALSWFDKALVQIDRLPPDTCIVSLTLPSKRSWSLPLLAVLSRDSSTSVSHRIQLPNLDPAPSCEWAYLDKEITVDACALRIRPISVASRPIINVQTDSDHMSVTILSPDNGLHRLSLYSAQGELIETSVLVPVVHDADFQWHLRHEFNMASRAQGLYMITLEAAGGIESKVVVTN